MVYVAYEYSTFIYNIASGLFFWRTLYFVVRARGHNTHAHTQSPSAMRLLLGTLAAALAATKAALHARAAASCQGWRQTGGCSPDGPREPDGDRPCDEPIRQGNSGYCQCGDGSGRSKAEEERAGYVTCQHSAFTCRETCARTNLLGYMEDTVWFWNDWRDVEFRSGGKFFAPDADNCHDGETCTWSVQGDNQVVINWGTAGKHTVTLDARRRRMDGARFDGDRCSGEFRRRDAAAGAKRHKKAREEMGTADGDDGEDDGTALYAVLELDPEATESDIKKAFRKLSRKYHPDKQRGKDAKAEAKAAFEKVREAYEVVGNPDKRILYDTGGIEAVLDAEKQDAAGGQQMDPFAAFFGGGRGNKQGRQAKKGNDAKVELKVSLEDMYNGNTVSASISRRVVCRGCKNGGKGKNRARCAQCVQCPNEQKTQLVQMAPGFNVQQQVEVPSKHRCKEEKTTLEAVVERGMDTKSEIKFERMSEQRPAYIPGDVIMVLKQKRHKTFRRDGNDLHMDMDITLREALVGFTKTIQHLDGHDVEITSNGRVTRPFSVMHLKDEGMPHHGFPSQKGVLHVKFKVIFPGELSDEQKKFVEDNF